MEVPVRVLFCYEGAGAAGRWAQKRAMAAGVVQRGRGKEKVRGAGWKKVGSSAICSSNLSSDERETGLVSDHVMAAENYTSPQRRGEMTATGKHRTVMKWI